MGKVITQNSEITPGACSVASQHSGRERCFHAAGVGRWSPRGRHRCRRAGAPGKAGRSCPRLCRDGQLHQDSQGLCLRLQAFFRLVPAPEPFSSPGPTRRRPLHHRLRLRIQARREGQSVSTIERRRSAITRHCTQRGMRLDRDDRAMYSYAGRNLHPIWVPVRDHGTKNVRTSYRWQ